MTQPIPPQPPELAPVSQEPPVPVPAPPAVEPVAEPPSDPAAPLSEEAKDEIIAKLRKENANWRTRLRDADPIIKAHEEAEEAAKTEVQRATERAAAVEQEKNDLIREVVAKTYGVPDEDLDFLGSGTREEMEAKGARYQARFAATPTATPPPPSDRPVESLRPGASPTPPAAPDTSYPESWRPTSRRART
ncbi:hypothetical protein AB0J48_20550 [Nocardia salmonicida]|uniref:hypothetical protein n=1 Tax=Nocardia salmonicida TaxID=53431 RepID=UPI0034196C3B